MTIDRKFLRVGCLVALAAASLLVLACNLAGVVSGMGSTPTPPPPTMAPQEAQPTPTSASQGGLSTGGSCGGSLPSDIPVYPGATVVPNSPTVSGQIMCETPDAPTKVVSFYSAQMPTNGWTLQNTLNGAMGPTQFWVKGSRIANINVSQLTAYTLIQIGWAG